MLSLLEDSSRLSESPFTWQGWSPHSLAAVNSSSHPWKCKDGAGDGPAARALGTAVSWSAAACLAPGILWD